MESKTSRFMILDMGRPGINAFLDKCIESGAPPLIFTGPEGIGKEYTALDFARRLCCSKRPACISEQDACDDCRRVMRLEHPALNLVYPTPSRGGNESEEDDLNDMNKILEAKREDMFSVHRFPKKTSIRIAKARLILKRAHTRPLGDGFNIFIIADAHAMRVEAQNALLKLIEEPPDRCVIVLVTSNNDALLYTVRSRCQRLRFNPLKPGVIEKILMEYYGLDTREACRTAARSRGSIKYARDKALDSDDRGREAARLMAAALVDAPEAWLISRAMDLSRGSNRDQTALLLQEMELLFRDAMAGEEDLIFNKDKLNEIMVLKNKWPLKELPGIVAMIDRARSQILHSNMNIDSTLAHLFLAIRRLG